MLTSLVGAESAALILREGGGKRNRILAETVRADEGSVKRKVQDREKEFFPSVIPRLSKISSRPTRAKF
jgi:hypothetical protein